MGVAREFGDPRRRGEPRRGELGARGRRRRRKSASSKKRTLNPAEAARRRRARWGFGAGRVPERASGQGPGPSRRRRVGRIRNPRVCDRRSPSRCARTTCCAPLKSSGFETSETGRKLRKPGNFSRGERRCDERASRSTSCYARWVTRLPRARHRGRRRRRSGRSPDARGRSRPTRRARRVPGGGASFAARRRGRRPRASACPDPPTTAPSDMSR